MKIFFQNTATSFVLFTFFLLISCQSNQLKVDVSDIEVNLDIRHFEQDLFENKLNTLPEFKKKYPNFFEDYGYGIIGFNVQTNEELFNQLMLFKTDANSKKLYDLVKQKFGDFETFKNELTQAYKYFKYHLPDEKIPSIVTYTSNFSFYINPVGDGYIGIALDMHMGSDFKYYDYANIETYWRKIQIPQSIVTNHMLAHANDLFSKYNRGKNFIDEMVYYGKLLYFLDATTPNVPDHIKIGMTKEEFDWCVKEEKNIWEFIILKKYLYQTDKREYERLLKEGPRTLAEGVPNESPAMIGKFSGWMLIRKYMNENKKISLVELMKDGNAEAILTKSAYKPE